MKNISSAYNTHEYLEIKEHSKGLVKLRILHSCSTSSINNGVYMMNHLMDALVEEGLIESWEPKKKQFIWPDKVGSVIKEIKSGTFYHLLSNGKWYSEKSGCTYNLVAMKCTAENHCQVFEVVK